MAKKKDDKFVKDENGFKKLSQVMLDQNNSLRKLIEELSRKEKATKAKNRGVDQ